MRERPILFSAPMVRAILAGAKTQTRRLVHPRLFINVGGEDEGENIYQSDPRFGTECAQWSRCPYGAPGDRLWVRETHAVFSVGEGLDRPVPDCCAYRATCSEDGSFDYVNGRGEVMGLKVTKWTPAIHMPRWASRITLEVTNVSVQRLQETSEDDARAEGVERDTSPCDHTRLSCDEIGCMGPTYRSTFCELWDAINGKRAAWSSNPWVWAVTFKRIEEATRG